MPSTLFSSLLSSNGQPTQHRCTCQCNQKEDSNSITRWFPRIRRRSSASSSSSSFNNQRRNSSKQEDAATPNSSRRASADSISQIEDKYVEEFIRMYDLAVDEMNYAIESQGSIYYDGDLSTATEAVDNCLDYFRELMRIINRDRSFEIQQKYTDTLFALRARLDELPYPSSNINHHFYYCD